MMYSEKVMEHFQNPHNVGILKDADGIGQVGNPVCGDMMTFYIKVRENHLTDIKFQTFGCGAAIAVSSMVSDMAMGKSLEEAKRITNQSVAEELGGLPKNKLHCSNLGADALHKAIDDYENRKKGISSATAKEHETHAEVEVCSCPYCEGPLEELEDYCTKCQVELKECTSCGQLTNKAGEKCSHCGGTLAPV